jgi:cholest-4-en-3-one 26-monooxygenase
MKIDVTRPELYAGDPYPAYEWLRENAPLYKNNDDANELWVVSRHADVCSISKDAELWSAEPSVLLDSDAPISMVCMDNPRHQRLRKLINRGFTPRMVARLESKVREILADCLDEMEQLGEYDLVEKLSVPVPLYIIAEMMGIPQQDFDRFHRWSDTLIGVTGAASNPAAFVDASRAYLEYGTYLKEIFESCRSNPRDDLVSILVQAQTDGTLAEDEEAMESDELVMFMTLLLVAGNETTRNAISGGMEAFIRNPAQRDLLLERPELLPSAVEEIIRYVAPIVAFRRTATRDTEMYGQKIERGERIVMLYQSANRDPSVFPDPDRFDITRDPNPHVSFGIGNHFCMGANLARMEVRVCIEALMQRFPGMEFAANHEPVRVASNMIRGIDSMRVVSSQPTA